MLWKKISFLLLLASNAVLGSHLRTHVKLDNVVEQ